MNCKKVNGRLKATGIRNCRIAICPQVARTPVFDETTRIFKICFAGVCPFPQITRLQMNQPMKQVLTRSAISRANPPSRCCGLAFGKTSFRFTWRTYPWDSYAINKLPENFLRADRSCRVSPRFLRVCVSILSYWSAPCTYKERVKGNRDMSNTSGSVKTNGMAITGFVCSFLCWPLGLIFSIIGMSQTGKDPSQGGRGLAIAGLVISIVCAVLSLVFWGALMTTLGLDSSGM